MGRPPAAFAPSFLAGNRTRDRESGLWAPAPGWPFVWGVTVSETHLFMGKWGSRSLSGPEPRSQSRHWGSATGLCGRISEPGHRRGLGTFPDFLIQPRQEWWGHFLTWLWFASCQAGSHTPPRQAVAKSPGGRSPWEQVTTAGGGGSDRGPLQLGDRGSVTQAQGTLHS